MKPWITRLGIDMGKFIITKNKKKDYRFHLKAVNGEILLISERYSTKQGCINGVLSVKRNAPQFRHYEKTGRPDGSFSFVLRASNGQAIGTGPIYATAGERDLAIESLMCNAPMAPLEDRS